MADSLSQERRRNARLACDFCRMRKIRCVISSELPCRNCEAMSRSCTFNLPSKPRGRRPKPMMSTFMPDMCSTWALPPHSPISGDEAVSSPSLLSEGGATYSDASITSPAVDWHAHVLSPDLNSSSSVDYIQDDATTGSPFVAPLPLRSLPPLTNPYSIDQLCSRAAFNIIIQDWMKMLYPLYPVLHRPTFNKQLCAQSEQTDPVFFGLLMAMCASVIAIIPSTFSNYQKAEPIPRFRTRIEMVNHCHELAMSIRKVDYFDQSTQPKWAISFLLAAAHGNLAFIDRALMLASEGYHHIRRMDCINVSSYSGLSKIEQQLRKKAVCMSSHIFFHEAINAPESNDRRLSVWFSDLDFEALLPCEVDDEFIFDDLIVTDTKDQTPVTAGFVMLSRLYFLASQPTSPSESSSSESKIEALHTRFEKLKYTLDEAPEILRPWIADDHSEYAASSELIREQFQTMRANIQVTHLWLQSTILEDIISWHVEQDKASPSPGSQQDRSSQNLQTLWDGREDICRQLLNAIYNVSYPNLSTNGFMMVKKVREVAATLLDCPFKQQGPVARRANYYLQTFANFLSKLDRATAENPAHG